MEKFNFIRTSDKEVKDELLKNGYQIVSDDGNYTTFINDITKCDFDKSIDKSKVQFTNMLCI